MKKFIVKTSIICLIMVCVCIIIELLLLTRTNTYSYKRDYMVQHANDIEVLLLGNSHIEEGIDPSVMGKGTFNAAISGRKTQYDVEIAKMYIPQMKNLKCVVMPLDYASFYLGREHINETDHFKGQDVLTSTFKCMYYKYMGIRIDGFWYWSEIINSKLDYMSRFTKDAKASRECDSLGYIKNLMADRTSDWASKFLPKIVDTSKPKDTNLYNQLATYYDSIAEVATNNHATLVLLGTPVYKTYLEYINEDVIKERQFFVTELQQKYNNVFFLDYTFVDTYGPEDFKDASHLSEKGAPKFSKKFYQDLLAIMNQE